MPVFLWSDITPICSVTVFGGSNVVKLLLVTDYNTSSTITCSVHVSAIWKKKMEICMLSMSGFIYSLEGLVWFKFCISIVYESSCESRRLWF